MIRYEVSITDNVGGTVIETVYSGNDYQIAFDAACNARSREDLRGKWIKFLDDKKVKWAVIS